MSQVCDVIYSDVFLSELCRECREGFIFQQQRDLREYAQATVYVRKVIDSKKVSFNVLNGKFNLEYVCVTSSASLWSLRL